MGTEQKAMKHNNNHWKIMEKTMETHEQSTAINENT